ncbi:MAG: hypothetical protein LBT10_02580 [Methanobrevibacter sp.]|jgi:hypothetical protein|nr:hypothetical protein [Methanobrevibacter sp.]
MDKDDIRTLLDQIFTDEEVIGILNESIEDVVESESVKSKYNHDHYYNPHVNQMTRINLRSSLNYIFLKNIYNIFRHCKKRGCEKLRL